MKKTKNLNGFLKKRKKISKVVEDVQARDSICSTITEYMNNEDCQIDFFSLKVQVQSDSLSSDILSGGLEISQETKEIKEEIEEESNLNTKKTNLVVSEVKERINKIKQVKNLNIPIDNNKLDTYLVLPKNFLRLSKIFKALLPVQKYNEVRKLSSFFVKSKGCIEKILKTRVEEEDIKRL